MDKKQLRQVVNQLAYPHGDFGLDVAAKMNETNAFITARSIEALAPKNGEYIAELGPGNGALSIDLVRAIGSEGRYLGIELSDDMAISARKTLREVASARVDIHSGDCRSVSLTKASLDGLIAVNVLYFIDDLDRLFNQIRPWLKPMGRCVFGIRPVRTLESLKFHDFGHHIRSPEIIGNRLQKSGFADISVTYHDEGEGSLGDITFPNGSIIIRAQVADES
ncbi:hypothetical protein C9J01_05530 [Photobacterium rosenbergii]|uniref:Methyltransferase domain-containing protein n=1 Tax=Photobacterium rosenbergii TaxID=294936 RepID=A0A2T3NLT8_9GAMM|nr:methyltransferase domain-containing protein [Photobacterium rosenbergii]PSW16460.1 hypothetical protein C9J01_05530 [Photobacterium rosenbergii]